jgi:hypothetical protein
VSQAAAAVRPTRSVGPWSARATTRPSDGERLAVVTAAFAVALLPLLVPAGPFNIAPVDIPIAVALLATMLWASLSGRRLRFAYIVPMALFIGAGAIGALHGPVPGKSAVALVQDLELLVWCWALLNIGSTAHRLGVLIRTWAYASIAWAGALFIGLFGGISYLSGRSSSEGTRTALTFLDPNQTGNYFFMSIMIIWATQCPRRRGWRVAAYALLFAAIVSTGSSGALASLALGSSLAAFLGIRRTRGAVPAISFAALAALALFVFHSTVSIANIQNAAAGSKYAFVRNGIGRGSQSVGSRTAILGEATGLYESSGGLGAGPVSTKPRLKNAQAPEVKEAHDDYVAALLERGAIGFAALLLLVASLLQRSVSFSTGPLSAAYGKVVPKPNALLGAVVGTLVAMAVYEVLHVRHVWTLFAFVAALSLFGREPEADVSS